MHSLDPKRVVQQTVEQPQKSARRWILPTKPQ